MQILSFLDADAPVKPINDQENFDFVLFIVIVSIGLFFIFVDFLVFVCKAYKRINVNIEITRFITP